MNNNYIPPEAWDQADACCDRVQLVTIYSRVGTNMPIPIAQGEMHVSHSPEVNNHLVAQLLRSVANILDSDTAFEALIESLDG